MLFTHGRGIIFGKPKDGRIDADLRPIVISVSILRLTDKVLFKIEWDVRCSLIGQYQIIGKSRALEDAKSIMNQANRLLERDNSLCMVNVDVSNAYNSVYRSKSYELLCKQSPILANYYRFLYGNCNRVEVDATHYAIMRCGTFQGLVSSECFYSMMKKVVIDNVVHILQVKLKFKFKLYFEIDYVDDGITIIEIKYLEIFLKYLIIEYKKYGMELNLEKTKIIIKLSNNNNNNINDNNKKLIETLAVKYKFKYNFDGNYTFLGVPYGTDQFINTYMVDKIKKIEIKLNYVLILKNLYIKHNLLVKFFDL
jgi:hypothetical protein